MAEEFVSMAQFGEFVKRMEERFDHLAKELVNVNKLADQRYGSINQRLADAEKARDQNLVHLNERFEDLAQSVNQRFDNLEKRLDFQNKMTLAVSITVGGGILVGLVKYLFFPG